MYDKDGTWKWAKTYDGPAKADDYPVAVGVDAQHNVYVTGASPGLSGYSDIVTLKYEISQQ
jgi:hypothetical protein